MDLHELLNEIRQFYLDHFRQVIKEKLRLPGAKIITEPALRQPGGQVARQGNLGLPIRTDLVIRSYTLNDSISVGTEKPLDFEPVKFEWSETLKATLAPFHWEQCTIQALGLNNCVDWQALVSWYEKWFDEFDSKAALKKDIQEVVHRLADPKTKDGMILFTVDFGSAPTVAFEEFLDALAKLGAGSIQIGEVKKSSRFAPALSFEPLAK